MSKENKLMRYILVFIINIISSLYECFYLWENPEFVLFFGIVALLFHKE